MIKKIKKATAILGLTILLSINSTSASADTTYEYSVLDEEDAPDQDEEQQEEETEEEETEDEEQQEEETEEEEYENTVTYYTDDQTAQFYEEVKTDLSDIKVLLFGIMITISFAGGYILSLIFKK